MHRRTGPGFAGAALAALLLAAGSASAGLFDVIDKVDERVSKTEKKVDQTTRIKDSSTRIKDKTGGLVDEAVPDAKEEAPAPAAAGEYFVESIDGGQRALTLEQAASEIGKGRIARDTLVWKEGMDDWAPAGEVSALKRHFRARPPPLPRKR